jgi:uncharacterized protein (TIGR03437 family)
LRERTQKLIYCLISGLLPIAVFGFSGGPPVPRTGAPSDLGGQNCSGCHQTFGAANSDPAGSVKIETGNYKPGIPQIIKVTVQHPQSVRWGFQLTARPMNDETKMAGTFTVDESIQVKCGPDGRSAPCDGALEFAEHRQATTHIGANGSATFVVEWTPPANEVGNIVFYAAGNAANGDGNLTGDHIYTNSLTISAGGSCGLTKKPILRAVVDAAALKPGLAMNSLLSLFGNDFQVPGNSRTAGRGDFVASAFPKQLGCIAVEVAGQRAPVTYVQSDQINAQIPSVAQTGTVNVQVIANPGQPNEVRSDMGTIALTNYAPQLFTFNGTSVAALLGTTIIANPSLFSSARPVKPGEIVTLFGTGFGSLDPVFQAGEIPGGAIKLRDPITVTIGGTTLSSSADIQYAGAAPGLISGLYQLNVRVPVSAADGDLPISVQIGGVTSATGITIPVKK